MIVKIISGNLIRLTDCDSAVVIPEIQEVGELPKGFDIVFSFAKGGDITYPLSAGDKIYYLNNDGKTIDKDFRCCRELKK